MYLYVQAEAPEFLFRGCFQLSVIQIVLRYIYRVAIGQLFLDPDIAYIVRLVYQVAILIIQLHDSQIDIFVVVAYPDRIVLVQSTGELYLLHILCSPADTADFIAVVVRP